MPWCDIIIDRLKHFLHNFDKESVRENNSVGN